jgi:hypothetical protein
MKSCSIIILVIALSFMAGSCIAENNTSLSLSLPQKENAPDMGTPIGSGIFEFRCNVEGAKIFLDGKEMGAITGGILQVPIQVYDHPVQRQLRMEAPGYSAYNETVLQSPKPGATMIVRGKLQVLPMSLTGTLSLAVSPPGGQVSIDDVVVGTVGPSGILTLRTVKSGTRIMKITLPGYQDYVQQIHVDANLITNMRIALLPLTTGTLQISSTPSGAQVSLNGSPHGITPFTASDLEKGTYTIIFSLPGYQTYQSQVVLTPGQNIPVSAILQPLPTQSPTLVPITAEPTPTPTPTQAGLTPVVAIVGLFVVLCLNLKKK